MKTVAILALYVILFMAPRYLVSVLGRHRFRDSFFGEREGRFHREFSPYDTSTMVLSIGLISSALLLMFGGSSWSSAGWLLNGLMIGYAISVFEAHWRRE